MKRLVSAMILLALCAMMVLPVLAAEFVPSITYKDDPSLVTSVDGDGNVVIGRIIDEQGNVLDYIHEHCLVVTPLAKAKKSTLIPDEAEELLLDVYADLKTGDMEIPYAALQSELENKRMVIRELFDASWLCEDHPEIVAPAGVHVELTFNLGISKNAEVYVFTYKNNAWNNIVSVVNNGDGTITCVFEDFCPIAFAVPYGSDKPPAQTGDPADIALWGSLMAVSAVALVAVLVLSRRKKAA